MATPDSLSSSPKRRVRTLARSAERTCLTILSYFPLAFVYGLTTWAVWVDTSIGYLSTKNKWIGFPSSAIGVILYIMLNLSYTVAVFTDPGSPLLSPSSSLYKRGSGRGQYSHLPTTELPEYQSYTVNSHGGARYCKKCQCPKPDRAHHCSSCKRCVLKMDHHCPWLATCVGLHNYKAFMLFLIYTSVFCWTCLVTAGLWVWIEVLNEVTFIDTFMPVNAILLAIIAGIVGLVLTCFTLWHLALALRNLTTIESLEKTRYLSPLRKALDRQRGDYHAAHDHGSGQSAEDGSFSHRLQNYGQQIIEAHANAIPGVTRAEEGEERPSPVGDSRLNHSQDYISFLQESNVGGTPAQKALHRSYEELERQRERERYEDYLDSKDTESIPNPFDHGWRQNLRHLFGENPLLWAVPICNTSGDGWHWEPSTRFLEARERIRLNREREWAQWLEQQRQHSRDHWINNSNSVPTSTRSIPIQRTVNNEYHESRPSSGVSMKTLRPQSPRLHRDDIDDDDDEYELDSEDEELRRQRRNGQASGSKADRVLGISRDQFGSPQTDGWRDWD